MDYTYRHPMPEPNPRRWSCCGHSFEDHEAVRTNEAMVAGITAGLLAGAASKNVLVAIGVAVAGAFVGNWIDHNVTPTCPLCGEVLKLLVSSALKR